VSVQRKAASVQRKPSIRSRFIAESSRDIRDRYDLEKVAIGTGGYGFVYRATCRDTKDVFAVKAVWKYKIKDMPDLEKEIELTRMLDHPNVVRLFSTSQDEKQIYLVLELCEGGELFQKIVEAKKLAETQVATIMKQILRSICYLHGAGIVHRDLKPENFLFQSKGVPLEHNTLKLIDFGLSKFLAEGEVLENLVGSAPYVAPEVVARSSGRPCDLWSCGAIMYMMLSGAPPFTGMNDRQVFQKAKSEKPRLIGRLWEPVSEAAKDLIRRLLDADPASRITAEHALESDWIKGESADKAALDPEIVRNLHRFSSASRFKRTALIAVAHQLREDEVETLRASFNAMDK
ncbi:unnamed protein product, partial [Polarella glacialis]